MKKLIAFVMALSMMLLLCACGTKLTSGDLIGIWSGSWEYNHHTINVSIMFNRDGTYVKEAYSDSVLSSEEYGSYSIDGNKIDCEDYDTHSITTYKYSGEMLKNNGHVLSKE